MNIGYSNRGQGGPWLTSENYGDASTANNALNVKAYQKMDDCFAYAQQQLYSQSFLFVLMHF